MSVSNTSMFKEKPMKIEVGQMIKLPKNCGFILDNILGVGVVYKKTLKRGKK